MTVTHTSLQDALFPTANVLPNARFILGTDDQEGRYIEYWRIWDAANECATYRITKCPYGEAWIIDYRNELKRFTSLENAVRYIQRNGHDHN